MNSHGDAGGGRSLLGSGSVNAAQSTTDHHELEAVAPPQRPEWRRAHAPRRAAPPRRTLARRLARIFVWAAGVPVVLLIALYFVLLVTPVPLPFVSRTAQAAVMALMPPSTGLELGEMAVALEGGAIPVMRFSPVTLTDSKTGSKIRMEALEIGFSPFRALVGQPGASVTLVAPHIQLLQDLLGPRLSSFEIVPGGPGEEDTVRILEGADQLPAIGINPEGVDVVGAMPGGGSAALRSDNDWLVFNMEGAEEGFASLVEQARQGRFSRLRIRDGLLDMNDSVYGVFRQFQGITLDLAPSPDGKVTSGTFGATLAGRRINGTVARAVGEDGNATLLADITNLDFAALAPFVADPTSVVGLEGAGSVSMSVVFDPATADALSGNFKVDLTGMDLRMAQDRFPIVSSIVDVDWDPVAGRFTMPEAEFRIGKSSASLGGTFVLGLDDSFGPTVAVSMQATDIVLHPNDMPAPLEQFTEMNLTAWSAPLYGASGIDQFVLSRPGARIATTGRVDMLRRGLGVDLTLAAEGVTADDLKRMWPYFLAPEARAWFLANFATGVVDSARMLVNFPVGALALVGDALPALPPGSLSVDVEGSGISVVPMAGMDPLVIDGKARVRMRDSNITITADGAQVPTSAGNIGVRQAAVVIDGSRPASPIIEISGDVDSAIPALIAMVKQHQPQALAAASLPVDLDSLEGSLGLSLVATVTMGTEGAQPDIDYVVTGNVRDFGSSEPLQGRTIGNGQLAFTANQTGYQLSGTTEIDGIAANIGVSGTPEGQPEMLLSATVKASDLAAMGFDASEFLSGQIEVVAKPTMDGTLEVAVGLDDAGLSIDDLGITKAAGAPGSLRATIRPDGDAIQISELDLSFGTVRLAGNIVFEGEAGLKSAEFSRFALSEGDDAQVALAPIEGGFSVRMRGNQLDLKPMLGKFFNVGEGSGGVATSFDTALALDIEIDRALGFYQTTAFNLDLDLSLRGTDLRRVNLQANMGDGSSISIVTNPLPEGKSMSVAVKDAGRLLRLLGVYPRLLGGEGTLVMNTRNAERIDVGAMRLLNFAIVDEENVAQILESQAGSGNGVSARNRLDFDSAEVQFIRRSDRIEVTEAVLRGDTVGGTARGFIYTTQGQYDLAGTFVPLFGINSAFQRMPLFGPLLGGRDGEGLIGVTFAVRGPLDNPQFRVNPASALVPGAFRELFEFRTREQPRAEE